VLALAGAWIAAAAAFGHLLERGQAS